MDERVGLWRGLSAKEWCFWTVVLEKTLESSLDCKEIQPVHSEGDQPWVFFGRNDAKAETPVPWPPHAKSWLIGEDSDAGRDWGQEEKGMTEDEMVGWHHRLDGHEFEWTPGNGDGQGGLAYAIHGVTKSWTRLTELNWTEVSDLFWPPVSWATMCFSDLNRDTEFQQQVNLFFCVAKNEGLVAYLRGKSFGQNELNYKNYWKEKFNTLKGFMHWGTWEFWLLRDS